LDYSRARHLCICSDLAKAPRCSRSDVLEIQMFFPLKFHTRRGSQICSSSSIRSIFPTVTASCVPSAKEEYTLQTGVCPWFDLEPDSRRVLHSLDRHFVTNQGSDVVDAVPGRKFHCRLTLMSGLDLVSPDHSGPLETQAPAMHADVSR
jgi:hypothetical protein